ncbi:hypothetical protein [Pedobacter sp. FW305-3-2-15-E-R2A2]|uniref:hypothetical protein n=1 Tax=Pedobacter sp. FW305-3-2-15-E-R2A2 TaxID=3140251 RepID=UPI00314067B0
MNIIKKLPLMAFLLGLGFMIAMSSFKGEVKRSTTYFYNHPSDLFSDMKIPGNWDTAQDADYTCAGPASIPCSVMVPDGVTIDHYLSSYSTLPALLGASDKRRQLK